MLLRLAPEAPLPTILFSLAFPTLPPDLPFPTAWAHQVKELVKMSLDSPPNPHALDRSVWATTLLDQVTFDLVANCITCIYIDGVRTDFTISSACRQMLIRVLGDVTDSASEAERERIAESSIPPPALPPPLPTPATPSTALSTPSHSPRSSLSAFPVIPPPPSSAPPAPPQSQSSSTAQSQSQSPPAKPAHSSSSGSGSGSGSTHRRSRSLLSTLLSALIPSSTVPTPPRAQLPMKKLTASRHLRRRARSTLVDCFRAHVLPEINTHLGSTVTRRWGVHGYAVWACTSMLGRVDAMVQYELDQLAPPNANGNGAPARRRNRDSAMILDYQESPFDDPEKYDPKSGQLLAETEEIKSLRQHADGLRGCAHKILMREQMIQNEEREALMMLEIRARRRAWSTNSRGGGGQRWMGLGTPLRPSRLAFSWTPDSVQYHSTESNPNFERQQHPRYVVHLPSEEIEQWSERIVVDDDGYHMQPSAPPSPPPSACSSPPMHAVDISGSTASLDFDVADEAIALESPDAADLDSEDDDDGMDMDTGGREILLPPELELPPGLHGPTNGRRGRASYYLPRPPAELVDAANGKNSPYRSRPGCAANAVYEDDPSSSSSSSSKAGLLLTMQTPPRARERAALLLDSPTQEVPQDAGGLEGFGNGDVVVGIVGVPQDVGLGVLCPLTPMPLSSGVALFPEDDVEGQDIEVGANADADVDADADADGERAPSLSPSPSSDAASVNTVSTGSEDLAEVAMAQIQVRTLGSSREEAEGEVVDTDTAEDLDFGGKPPRPPRNPSRLAKGDTGTTATGTTETSEVVAGVFAY